MQYVVPDIAVVGVCLIHRLKTRTVIVAAKPLVHNHTFLPSGSEPFFEATHLDWNKVKWYNRPRSVRDRDEMEGQKG